jgi:hypothetical protein
MAGRSGGVGAIVAEGVGLGVGVATGVPVATAVEVGVTAAEGVPAQEASRNRTIGIPSAYPILKVE